MTFKIITKTNSEGTRYLARRKGWFFWRAVEVFTYSMESVEMDYDSKEKAMEAIAKYVARKSLGTVYEEEIIEC